MLNLLLDFAEIPKERGTDVFRVLDKLEKVGLEKIRAELMEGYKDESGDTIRGLGLTGAQVEKIEKFLEIRGDSRRDVLLQVADLFKGLNHEVLNPITRTGLLNWLSRRSVMTVSKSVHSTSVSRHAQPMRPKSSSTR